MKILVILLLSICSCEASDILIVNSDRNVEKYVTIEKEFKKNFSTDIVTVSPEEYDASISPEVVYCIGTRALTVVQKNGYNKIVFSSVLNWRQVSGKSTFGVANDLHIGMQVTLFKYFFPKLNTIAVLYNERYNAATVEISVQEAAKVGITAVPHHVNKPEDLETVISSVKEDAIWLIADPIVIANKHSIETLFKQSDANKIPVFSYTDAFSKNSVLVLSSDTSTIARQASIIADQLMVGEHVIPITDPAGSNILLNRRLLKKYGLQVNVLALKSINSFIE